MNTVKYAVDLRNQSGSLVAVKATFNTIEEANKFLRKESIESGITIGYGNGIGQYLDLTVVLE